MWIEGKISSVKCSVSGVEARESLVDRRCMAFKIYRTPSARRGSREPCGSKVSFPSQELSRSDCRGSREPCGSKGITYRDNSGSPWSRLARALWIEGSSSSWCPHPNGCRGSREPCGSKVFSDAPLLCILCRGSREPCGSKAQLRRRDKGKTNRRGSREPCGSKGLNCYFGFGGITSRLARALWIEGCAKPTYFHTTTCRGSREPCGSKARMINLSF